MTQYHCLMMAHTLSHYQTSCFVGCGDELTVLFWPSPQQMGKGCSHTFRWTNADCPIAVLTILLPWYISWIDATCFPHARCHPPAQVTRWLAFSKWMKTHCCSFCFFFSGLPTEALKSEHWICYVFRSRLQKPNWYSLSSFIYDLLSIIFSQCFILWLINSLWFL